MSLRSNVIPLATRGLSISTKAARAPMALAPVWLQAVVLTFTVGFATMDYLAIRVYQDHPPVRSRVVSASGRSLFTAR